MIFQGACRHDRRAQLTCGLRVSYGRLPVPVAEFVFEGRDEHGTLHLWQADGRWRCEPHAGPHPFDLVLTPAK